MWYSVEALFRCSVQDETSNDLYEKTIFLINAKEDEKEVSKKAEQMALKFEKKYKNHLGNKVYWHLVKILQIQNLVEKKLYDGVEVFSHLMWERDVSKDLRVPSYFSKRKKVIKTRKKVNLNKLKQKTLSSKSSKK